MCVEVSSFESIDEAIVSEESAGFMGTISLVGRQVALSVIASSSHGVSKRVVEA